MESMAAKKLTSTQFPRTRLNEAARHIPGVWSAIRKLWAKFWETRKSSKLVLAGGELDISQGNELSDFSSGE